MKFFSDSEGWENCWNNTTSEVVIGKQSWQLCWKQVSDNEWTAKIDSGVWHLRTETQGSRVVFCSSADLSGTEDSFEYRMLIFSAIPAEHVLPAKIHMGNCHGILTENAEGTEFTSYNICAVTAEGQTVLVSNPLNQEQIVVYSGRIAKGSVENFTVSHTVTHYSPRRVIFAPVTFEWGAGIELLENYGKKNAPVNKKMIPPLPGWNTWDYYRTTITEEEVLKNAEFIAKDPVLSKYVKRIIVDDGWEYCYGEWEANPLFPSGMEHLASEIRKLGFEAGLWFAPCIVEPVSPIAQIHYDMLACSEGGQPCLTFSCMKRLGFILDPTVPKSRKFLADTFDRYCRRGYTYFKLDFLRWIMEARKFADSTVPRSKLVNKLMEPIAEGVAGRAAITGCNYPFMTGTQFVDAVRIASDIHSVWKNIAENASTAAGRFWMNGKLWYNDPDFAVCRGPETSDFPETLMSSLIGVTPEMPYDPLYSQTFASAKKAEAEVLFSIILMAAGAVNLSDNLTKLNEAGLELVRKIVSAERGETGIPLDLFYSEKPSFWIQKLKHGGRFLVVNWDNAEKEMLFPQSIRDVLPSQAEDFWKGTTVKTGLSTVLLPHHALLLQW